uniref:Uncharacterized protein n=1 Tax=Hyaloperonospora arabidopsidis (strain Emoy2) TaxID=559515 RepID=M4B3V6_HYAAE
MSSLSLQIPCKRRYLSCSYYVARQLQITDVFKSLHATFLLIASRAAKSNGDLKKWIVRPPSSHCALLRCQTVLSESHARAVEQL